MLLAALVLASLAARPRPARAPSSRSSSIAERPASASRCGASAPPPACSTSPRTPTTSTTGSWCGCRAGSGVRTALLTVTRGEGGQNAIGPGAVRRARRAAHGRAARAAPLRRRRAVLRPRYEFGYSFSVEETFAKWGREETLGDIVRVIRRFRPDVMLVLPLAGEGGGQHHYAAAQLAQAAFRAAADPARFADAGLAAVAGAQALRGRHRRLRRSGREHGRRARADGRLRSAAGHDLAAARRALARDAPQPGREPGRQPTCRPPRAASGSSTPSRP